MLDSIELQTKGITFDIRVEILASNKYSIPMKLEPQQAKPLSKKDKPRKLRLPAGALPDLPPSND